MECREAFPQFQFGDSVCACALIAVLTCLMLFATPLVTSTARADDFFGNELSPRERHSLVSEAEKLGTG